MKMPRPAAVLSFAFALLGLALWCAVSHRALERRVGALNYHAGERERNPYFARMNEVGKRWGLDLEHTQVLQRGRAFQLAKSRLFQLQQGQLDVLIVGDSSAVWGLSPSVASAVSGQRVGIFAYEQARPTYEFMRATDTLAKAYLAEGGLVLLCFAPQGWDRSPKSRQGNASLQGITAMSPGELLNFIEQKREPSAYSGEAMVAHWEQVEARVNALPWFGPAKLPESAVYATWIEPLVAPKTARAARENAEDETHAFYFWDEWNSVLELCSSCSYRKPRTEVPKDRKPSKRMVAAAKRAGQLAHRLGFVITFYGDAKRSAMLRGLYHKHLKHLALVDLESMWPARLKVAVQGGSHVANEGALYQSLLLGEWLKRFQQGDPQPNRRLDTL